MDFNLRKAVILHIQPVPGPDSPRPRLDREPSFSWLVLQ